MTKEGQKVVDDLFIEFMGQLVGSKNPQGYNPNDIERLFLQAVVDAPSIKGLLRENVHRQLMNDISRIA